MMFRTLLAASCFVLVSCGGQTATNTADRLEQVENDCSVLTSDAGLKTGKAAPSNFCYCMVQVLEEGPEINAEVVGHTLGFIASEHEKTGELYRDIAKKLRTAAAQDNATDGSKSLGIGIEMVRDVSTKVRRRAKSGTC